MKYITRVKCTFKIYWKNRNSFGSCIIHKKLDILFHDFIFDSIYQYRKTLPSPMVSRHDFNLWSVLKNCIGKELSKITMPVVFNEPLTFLQRMTEYMEYARLLRMAAEQDDPIERIKYVAGMFICKHTHTHTYNARTILQSSIQIYSVFFFFVDYSLIFI